MKGIRSISGRNVPIYAWESGAASACMYLFGPEQFGGAGDLLQKVQEIKAENEEERKKEIKRVRLYLFSVPCPISADVFESTAVRQNQWGCRTFAGTPRDVRP